MELLNVLDSFSWLAGSAFCVAAFIIFAIVGLLIVRQVVPPKTLKAHHDVAGFVFANLGVLYSVLLGFTVVNVQQRFDAINQVSQTEAAYLAELFRDSAVFADKNKLAVRNAIKAYGQSVLHEEWPSLARGEPHPHTHQLMSDIWHAYYDVELTTKKQELWYSESISKLNQLNITRLQRVLGGHQSLGAEMWTLLIMGGIVMVAFIWFFGLDKLNTHILMASILAASIAFLLFLIYSLDTAFSGAVQVDSEGLQKIVSHFKLELG